jgi:WSC domain
MFHVSHRTTLARVNLLTLLQIRDNVAARTLTSVGYTDAKNMTVENCVNFCNTQDFIYAGAEYGQECCK